jgi:hypothetical protein
VGKVFRAKAISTCSVFPNDLTSLPIKTGALLEDTR